MRGLRPAGPGEIAGDPPPHPLVRPDPHRDHVARDAFAEADAGIEALLNDVDEVLVDRGDADCSRRALPQCRQAVQPRLDFVERRAQIRGKLLARLGRDDPPGGPREKAQVEAFLQPLDRVAERRLRGAKAR